MQQRYKTSFEGTSSEYSQSGTGTSEARYKKALKQINRLVSLTSSLKKQVQLWQQNYSGLEKQHEELLAKYNQLLSKRESVCVEESPILRSETANMNLNVNILNSNNTNPNAPVNKITNSYLYQPSDEDKVEEQVKQKQQMIDRLSKQNEQFVEQINYQRKQILELENKIAIRDEKINEMKLMLEQKHSKIIELEGRCGDLNEKMFKMEKEFKDKDDSVITKQKQQQKERAQEKERDNISILVTEQLMKQKRRVGELQQKLKSTEQWSKQIQGQYETLRRQVILSQNSIPSSKSSSSLIMTSGGRMSSEVSESPRHKQPLLFSVKGADDISTLRKEYNEKKEKYKHQIGKLREDNEALNTRVTSMLRLIHKQQEYIESFGPPESKND